LHVWANILNPEVDLRAGEVLCLIQRALGTLLMGSPLPNLLVTAVEGQSLRELSRLHYQLEMVPLHYLQHPRALG